MTPFERLRTLLRDLLRLDLADLDFGLYRLLHLRRDEIESFLAEQLPRRVDEALLGFDADERRDLEGYEDALHNLVTDRTLARAAVRSTALCSQH
ncbi:MAG TPA: hypothetical protein VGT40_13310 [Methylomirabilota bacterium]|jgi:adenine-specific DNA-methyltransferase|nr:hypothetical protein [Methylomirabilota bacterium]